MMNHLNYIGVNDMTDVYAATNKFVEAINVQLDASINKDMRHVSERYSVVSAKAGQSYIKLTKTSGGSNSAFAFIIINDNKMGKSGDILKAASWAAPAKHARGNVFSDTKGMEAVNCYGHINYMK